MQFEDEYFGNPEKIALMRRSAALWSLVNRDPRFAWYGRLVATSDPCAETAHTLKALAGLQGAAVAYYYPKSSAAALFAELEARGLRTDRHEHYRGGEAAYAASKAALEAHSLPDDLSVSRLGPDTPGGFVAAVAQLCEACEVMPVPGAVMRGVARRGINFVACEAGGRPVASVSSFMLHHPDSPHANDVFWGMLATRPDRRGQKIALVLGAMAIVHMWQEEGARGFMTGVRQDNRSSQALCERLGVGDTDWVYATCLDPVMLGGSSVTK